MNRKRYLLFRTVQTVFLLWLVLTLLFFLFRMMPGNYIDLMVQAGASPETVAKVKKQWGYDQPLYVQYWQYLVNLLQFDVGNSLQYNEPVWKFVRMKIFNSFVLIAPAITFTYVLGGVIGTVMGTNRDELVERYGIVPVMFFGTVPSFVLGIFLIIVFSSWLGWFPTSGILDINVRQTFQGEAWWRPYLSSSFAWHYVLPFTAITLRYLFLPTLIMRTSIVEVMGQDFIFYHRITGLSKFQQLRHLAKHASLPLITLYPVSMTRAIGGLVLVETVFNWPGIGFTLVEAVLARDYPIVQFVFFLVAAFIIVSNFVVDLVYGYIDPRVSIEN